MNESNGKTGVHSIELFQTLLPMLEEGKRAVFTVSGMSMWPFICHGRDQVVVEKCDSAALRVGDIVLFRTPLGNYMLHRVSALRDGQFESTGDANCFRDGWFPLESTRARVTSIIRDGRTIDCDSPRWRLAFSVWGALFPVRQPVLRLCKWLGDKKRGI